VLRAVLHSDAFGLPLAAPIVGIAPSLARAAICDGTVAGTRGG
jgi:hypothetical protein